MPMLPVFFMQSCLKDQLLKHVADAQGDALPAKGSARNKVERGLPVQGNLERNGREAVFQTDLCASTHNKDGGGESKVNLRTEVEIERSEGSDGEVIGKASVEITQAPAQIQFAEVVATQGVLIGKLGAITGTDTNSAGLCGSHNGRGQDSGQNYKDFLHDK